MVNRQRFLQRYRSHIKKAVSDAVDKRPITDMERGEQISIPQKDISEPIFHHGKGGKNSRVLPGNDQFIAGDHIARPPSGSGGGGSGEGASDSGEGNDEFVFQITQDEFLNYVFEDLELPNLVKRQLSGLEEFEFRRAGFSSAGNPSQINVVRSLRSANARRIALGGKSKRELKALQEELEALDEQEGAKALELKEKITALKRKVSSIPWLDDYDLKYNLLVKRPLPHSKAVMFCIMDVSGSMDQATKDIAKRFFLLLYLFLQRNYKHTEVVFIRHHTSAKEVDEEEFFYSRETGGTIVSSALHLMDKIIADRYPSSVWNIYGAQASDGDNWNDDSDVCHDILTEKILPNVQYFSYIEITDRERQALWHAYEAVQNAHPESFAMRNLSVASEIYSVFRDLFQKKAA
jgi:uncharacterized sporulation protein YeaH/YhbH (DUF444 family)